MRSDPTEHEIIVLVKAYEPEHLEFARRAAAAGTAIVFDLCDNHFWPPASDRDEAARQDRLREMLELADVITVPTPELAETLHPVPTCVVPDALEELPATAKRPLRLAIRDRFADPSLLRLLWFGNAGSERRRFGLVDLAGISGALEQVASRRPTRLTVVSNDRGRFREHLDDLRMPKIYVPWNRRTFAGLARAQDICLLPATPNPFTRSKSPNRLLTAFLLGLPSVVGALPSYLRFGRHVLVERWHENILRYADDPELRRTHVAGGAAAARERFGDDAVVSAWADTFARAVEQKDRR